MEDALKIDPTVFQSAVQVNMSTDDLVDLVKMNLQSSTTSYSSVLGALGYSDYAKPGSIWIYPKSFEAKNRIVDSLTNRDLPVIYATVLFLAFALVIFNILADIIQRLLQTRKGGAA